jgi:putative acyl-CoA dehydrogenase
MVNHTRLDCVLGSTGLMRRATAEAAHHAAHRMAFGQLLADQPLMRNVLADLEVETEAATLTSLRLARAYDEAWAGDAEAKQFARLATAVSKYWVCKRTPPTVAEALECLGGNGFVEDSGLPRLYRESPLNSIWEGSGNVIALDVLRAMARSPQSVEAFFAEIATAQGGDHRLDAYAAKLRDDLADAGQDFEHNARRLVERMALAFQGSLLVRHGDPAVAQAFVASRLEGDRGLAFGTLPPGLPTTAIVERATPRLD